MKTQLMLLAAMTSLILVIVPAQAGVFVSLNVFPIDLASPHNGGDWTLVAKTDNLNGIAAINALLQDVDNGRIVDGDAQDDITLSGDIGAIDPINGNPPYLDQGFGATDLIYGQDITTPSSVVILVGTLATSDGPDPLGDPAWDDATLIAFGTYSSNVPSFNGIGANELGTTSPPFSASEAIPTTSVVRVAVPEPTSIVLCAFAVMSLLGVSRRRH